MIPTLKKAAEADNHGVIQPTDVVFKGGKMVGYISVNAVPSIIGWMSTKECNVHDTKRWMDFWLAKARKLGGKMVFVPIPVNSPCFPFAERLGMTMLSEKNRLFIKAL